MPATLLSRPATLLLLSTVLLMSTTACTTPSLSKEQCLSGDWQGIGYSDGANGYRPERVNEHAKACSKLEISPDLGRYQQGWNQGVRQFCTPARAYQTGSTGSGYHGLCPVDLAGPFNREYQHGLRDYCSVPSRAFLDGKEGKSYHGQYCPMDLEPAFRLAYDRGNDLNQARKKVESMENQRKRLIDQLAESKDDKERINLRRELRRVEDDLYQARNVLRDQESRAYYYLR